MLNLIGPTKALPGPRGNRKGQLPHSHTPGPPAQPNRPRPTDPCPGDGPDTYTAILIMPGYWILRPHILIVKSHQRKFRLDLHASLLRNK